jgi:hypothetical protein
LGTFKLIVIWVICVIVGAAVGAGIGYLIWKLGFEIIGSAIALVGAGLGGILAFLWYMQWSENRQE